jgi:hypothetical protein
MTVIISCAHQRRISRIGRHRGSCTLLLLALFKLVKLDADIRKGSTDRLGVSGGKLTHALGLFEFHHPRRRMLYLDTGTCLLMLMVSTENQPDAMKFRTHASLFSRIPFGKRLFLGLPEYN